MDFNQEEWRLLGPVERTEYRDVMLETLDNLVSVGKSVPTFRLPQGPLGYTLHLCSLSGAAVLSGLTLSSGPLSGPVTLQGREPWVHSLRFRLPGVMSNYFALTQYLSHQFDCSWFCCLRRGCNLIFLILFLLLSFWHF